MSRTCPTPCVLFVCLAALAFGGCARSYGPTSILVRQHPAFYDPNIQALAVLPFQNDTKVPGAGELAAENLAAALQVNGTYKVIPPSRLQKLVKEGKLASLSPTDYRQDAEQLRKLGTVQAFIAGRVLADERVMGSAPIDNPYLDAYTRGNFPDEQQENEFGHSRLYHYWYWSYPYYGNYVAHTYAALEASIIRVSDGAVLYTTPVPATGGAGTGPYHSARGPTSPQGAMHEAVSKLVKDFAIVPAELRVHPDTALRTARGRAEGRWEFSNLFHTTDQTLYVVLEFPAAAGGNTLRLTVTPAGEPDQILATKDLTWPIGRTSDAVEFSLQKIAAYIGSGSYTVNCYSLGQLTLQHDFTIQR
ncbi:MAG: hypothetical protein M1376_14195 [Planctomycetes bacterium]|nr:hypothetical protein [Planctomycetota bacterium]